jgi:hypothetical protein
MRLFARLVGFTLFISLAASVWHIPAQKKSAGARLAISVDEEQTAPTSISESSGVQQDLPAGSIKFGPVEAVKGCANSKTIILREGPDASAPVRAKLSVSDYESAQILGATRDFIHVRFVASPAAGGNRKRKRDYEGWTHWGSVVPTMSAIILDAETGAVVSRVPLGNGFTSAAYSPDGERAIFYGGRDGSMIAAEARTSDYTLTRSLISSTDDRANSTLFYGPSDGALYVVVLRRGENYETTPTKLSIVRMGDEGSTNAATKISVEAEDFAVAPDGFTGFVLHREDKIEHEMKVDVVDLRSFRIRNSFMLQGTDLPQVADVFVVNTDGTELYERLDETGSSVSVIDTRTGLVKRVLPFYSRPKDYWYFDRGDLIGDSLLLRVWNQDEDEIQTPPHTVWLGSGGRTATERGLAYAVQTGEARYAVNREGTRLLKLDSDNHVRLALTIERPELRKGRTAEDGLGIFGLSVSPDGKRLIMFVGIEGGNC